MLLTVSVALAIAILSGLGVGSAGLLVVFLTVVSELPQRTAQGVNLMFFLFASGAALIVHLRRTPLLYGCILLLLLGGIPGCLIGTALAHAISEALLRRLFGVLLIVSGALSLFRSKKK